MYTMTGRIASSSDFRVGNQLALSVASKEVFEWFTYANAAASIPVCRSEPVVVSTVAHFGRQRWTKAVFAAPFPLSLSAILQHSSRLEKRVTTERAYRLNRAPVGPARAPPL